MTVTPRDIGTFMVSSRSGGHAWLVELDFKEEIWRKPRPLCGCWRSYCHGEVCVHILCAVEWEKKRLGL